MLGGALTGATPRSVALAANGSMPPKNYGAALRALSPLRRPRGQRIHAAEKLPKDWRRGRDSNPRTPFGMLLTFQASAFDHSATYPYSTFSNCREGLLAADAARPPLLHAAARVPEATHAIKSSRVRNPGWAAG